MRIEITKLEAYTLAKSLYTLVYKETNEARAYRTTIDSLTQKFRKYVLPQFKGNDKQAITIYLNVMKRKLNNIEK